MDIRQVAVLLMRFGAIEWALGGVILVPYLPGYIARAQVSEVDMEWLKVRLVSIALHFALGIGLWIYSRTLASILTRDLIEHDEQLDLTAAA